MRATRTAPAPAPQRLATAAAADDPALRLRHLVLDQLHSRQWRAGQRLPTERALGEQFQISRAVVRRVLADLRDKGLITQTVGSGTYVAEGVNLALAALAPAEPTQAVSPADLMAARLALEPALIDLVIGHATAADFARMDACNDQAEAAATLEGFEHWDAALHAAIAAAAHNSFVAQVQHLMNAVRAQAEWGVMKRRSATPERRQAYQHEHRLLVAALKDRDAARARALCLAHLQHVRQNLLGG